MELSQLHLRCLVSELITRDWWYSHILKSTETSETSARAMTIRDTSLSAGLALSDLLIGFAKAI